MSNFIDALNSWYEQYGLIEEARDAFRLQSQIVKSKLNKIASSSNSLLIFSEEEPDNQQKIMKLTIKGKEDDYKIYDTYLNEFHEKKPSYLQVSSLYTGQMLISIFSPAIEDPVNYKDLQKCVKMAIISSYKNIEQQIEDFVVMMIDIEKNFITQKPDLESLSSVFDNLE